LPAAAASDDCRQLVAVDVGQVVAVARVVDQVEGP